MITRLCEHLALTERVRLAVTEACTNCVLHAYDEFDETAAYVLDARVEQHALRVTGCDHGLGIHNGRPSKHASGGLGLALIEQLANSADIVMPPERRDTRGDALRPHFVAAPGHTVRRR